MQIHFDLYSLLLGITLLFGLVRLKKLTGPFRLLVLLIGYVLVAELSGRALMSMGFENTFSLYHLSAIVLITLTSIIYLKLLGRDSPLRRFSIILSIVCGLMAILNSLFHQHLHTFPSFSIAAHAFQSIIFALLMFSEMIKTPATTPLLKQAVFWFNCGTFLYYSSNFVGFVLYNAYYQFKDVIVTMMMYLNWTGNIVIYSCYLIAIYLNQKRSDEQ